MNHNKASLCKTRKEKLYSSKRIMCINWFLSTLGNRFQIMHKTFKSINIFFHLKHFFFDKNKIYLAFCTTEHAGIQCRNYISSPKCYEAFCLMEIGYIQSKRSHCVNPYLPTYVLFFFKQENIKSESSLSKRRSTKKRIFTTQYMFLKELLGKGFFFGLWINKISSKVK